MGQALTRGLKLTLRGAIFLIDWVLRRCYGVREFSAGRDDLLRVSVSQANHDLVLADGARIAAGDSIIDVHIWNERLGRPGSTLSWASRFQVRMDHSLSNLADRIRADPSLQSCKAVRAEAIYAAGREADAALKIARRFGFTRIEGRAASPGETLVSFCLAWACNPQSLRGKPFRRVRNELWISRAALLERYPAPRAASVESGIAAPGGAAPGEPRPVIEPAALAGKSVLTLDARQSSGEPRS